MKKLITTSSNSYSYQELLSTMEKDFAFEGIRFKEIFINPEYFKSNKQGLLAALVYLSPDEYMRAVELRQTNHKPDDEKLERIRDYRDAGNKFEAPFLEYGYRDLSDNEDYKHFAQEGYNRACYMEMMGLKEIPVFIRYREDDMDIPEFIREKLQESFYSLSENNSSPSAGLVDEYIDEKCGNSDTDLDLE